MKRISKATALFIVSAAAMVTLNSSNASAAVPIRFQTFAAPMAQPSATQTAIRNQLQSLFGKEPLREIVVRQMTGSHGEKYLLVRLHSARYHKFERVRIELDSQSRFQLIQRNYRLQPQDQAINKDQAQVACPDETTEFISFAPNDDEFEQGIARDVAGAAQLKGLKTVLLLGQEATRQAYLNYMSCPNLKGNFYDGDSDPQEMVTADGTISADDYNSVLKEKFRFKVTNIWLACQAFNDPMLSSVLTGAQAQKYAAGKNDLQIGPSDQAAACAMKAAINGAAMTAAFQDCYTKLDFSDDQWGFEGQGSDFFGQ